MKTGAERLAELRARRRKAGLKPYEFWLSKRELKAVRLLLKDMRSPDNQ